MTWVELALAHERVGSRKNRMVADNERHKSHYPS